MADYEKTPRLYAFPYSIFPGDTLSLFVSSKAETFWIFFFRQETSLRLIGTLSPINANGFAGASYGAPSNAIPLDPGWPQHQYAIPADWPTGVYFAIIVERTFAQSVNDGAPLPPVIHGSGSYSPTGRALFVVKRPLNSLPAPILYKLATNTFNAYNVTFGCSGYAPTNVGGFGYAADVAGHPGAQDRNGDPHAGTHVPFLRPGLGTGGDVAYYDFEGLFPQSQRDVFNYNGRDYFDDHSPRNTFEHWDAKFISWLYSFGFASQVDFCADVDVDMDDNDELLLPHQLLLSVGHDEYWTPSMQANVLRFIESGGHIAFFSGNIRQHTGWFVSDYFFANQLTVHPDGGTGPINAAFLKGAPDDVQRTIELAGVDAVHGQYWQDQGAFRLRGFQIFPDAENHWVFNGIGLSHQLVSPFIVRDHIRVEYRALGVPYWKQFGWDAGIVGYEVDGIEYQKVVGSWSQPSPVPGFTPLAVGWVESPGIVGGVSYPEIDRQVENFPGARQPPFAMGDRPGNSTMGIRCDQSGAYVFTASTTDWARGLVNMDKDGQLLSVADDVVRGITTNVVRRLAKKIRILISSGAQLICGQWFAATNQLLTVSADYAAGPVFLWWNNSDGPMDPLNKHANSIGVYTPLKAGRLTISVGIRSGTDNCTDASGRITVNVIDQVHYSAAVELATLRCFAAGTAKFSAYANTPHTKALMPRALISDWDAVRTPPNEFVNQADLRSVREFGNAIVNAATTCMVCFLGLPDAGPSAKSTAAPTHAGRVAITNSVVAATSDGNCSACGSPISKAPSAADCPACTGGNGNAASE